MSELLKNRSQPFYGYSNESARTFIDRLNTYLTIKDIARNRWSLIFRALLQGTARIELETAGAYGGVLFDLLRLDATVIAGRAEDATPLQRTNGHQQEYNLHCQWLLGKYAGIEVQQELQDDLIR